MKDETTRLVLPLAVLALASSVPIGKVDAQNTPTAKQTQRIPAKVHLLPVTCPNGFVPADSARKCVADVAPDNKSATAKDSLRKLGPRPNSAGSSVSASTVSPAYSSQ
jgi:hypothetical protein